MANKQRIIETSTPCPHCGTNLRMRQTGLTLDQADVVRWVNESRSCPRGCLITAGDFQE